MRLKRWTVAKPDKVLAKTIADALSMPYLVGMLLTLRGVKTVEEAVDFLQQDGFLVQNSLALPDMEQAVARIHTALNTGETIAVYGDYDADGITSTALLCSYLDSVGGNWQYYIPDRETEGYGMNKQAVEKLSQQGVSLIVTVDNGVSAMEEIAYAKELGIDVVVTDHHRPRDVLPDAVAVVDLHRKDCHLPFVEFCGVGIAFLLILALEGADADLDALVWEYADLVCIGTIGDVVSLTGENRTLVRLGLQALEHTGRPGLRSLLAETGYLEKSLTATDVAFTLVPRLNAVGRMEHASLAVELLLCEDGEAADRMAEEVCRCNVQRRAVEQEILTKVDAQLLAEPWRLNHRVIVVEGEQWHHGVIGIVASRLVDRFGKPCLVLSAGEEEIKGSARSVEGFSLFDALHQNAPLLTKYGGHPMAAGFSFAKENRTAFYEAMYAYAKAQPQIPVQQVTIDCKLKPAGLSVAIPKLLSQLEPFGTDNPQPRFGLMEMTLRTITPVGEGKHLRLTAEKDGTQVPCMLFGTTKDQLPYTVGDVVDLAVQLSVNQFQGQECLSVIVREHRLSGLDDEALIADYAAFESYKSHAALTEQERIRLLPRREDFSVLYRFLRQTGEFHGSLLSLLKAVGGNKFGLGKLLVCLTAMRQLKLLACRTQGEGIRAVLLPTKEKVALTEAPILQELETRGKGEDMLVQ